MWQTQYLPLAVIRQKLEGLGDDDVVSQLATEAGEPGAKKAPRPAPGSRVGESALEYLRTVAGAGNAPPAADRSTWERIDLTPDLQLHVRRPQTREQNRRIERLVEEARKILAGN